MSLQKGAKGPFARRVMFAMAAVASAMCATGAPAYADDPVAFSDLSANCDHDHEQSFHGSPVTAAHPGVVVRYSVDAGSARLNSWTVGQGDVVWAAAAGLDPNDSPSVYASCYESSFDVPFTATFFDRPGTPTTFSGAGGTNGNYLGFVAPGAAQYVADLTLTGGGVEISSPYTDRTQRFASSGQFSIGTLPAGNRSLSVVGLDGPRPEWSIRIRALPVAISDLSFDQPVARPGTFLEAGYTTSGDTSVNAVVRNGAGVVVKTLASELHVDSGGHSLPWDGRGDDGQSLPDGSYTLRLDSRDPSGQASSASTALTLDGTPPAVAITSPATIAPGDAVSGQLVDVLTGIASARIEADGGYESVTLPAGQTAFSLAPSYGDWKLGAHTLTVTATDGAGNERTVAYTFTVTNPAAPASSPRGSGRAAAPSCTKVSARKAVARSTKFSRAIRRLGNGRYGVRRVVCADLDHDGDRDMAALMVCCTVSSYSPVVIFRNIGGKWRPAFIKTKLIVFRMSRKGRSLRLKTPRYRRTDANCCPSSYRYYSVTWKGTRFRLARGPN